MTAIRIIDDHIELANIGSNTHTQIDTHIAAADNYVKRDGSLALTANWDIGDTRKILADEIRARDAAGLKLYDDGGNGIFVKDGGNVGVGTNAPGHLLEILGKGNTYETYSMYVTDSVGERQFAVRDDGRAYFGPATSYIDTISSGWIKVVSSGIIIQATGGNLVLKGDDDAADSAIVFMDEGGAEHMRIVTGTTNTGNVGIDTTTPTAKLDVNSDILRLRTAKTPATAGAAGNQGDICWDAGFIYVCTATNSWERAAIAAW